MRRRGWLVLAVILGAVGGLRAVPDRAPKKKPPPPSPREKLLADAEKVPDLLAKVSDEAGAERMARELIARSERLQDFIRSRQARPSASPVPRDPERVRAHRQRILA